MEFCCLLTKSKHHFIENRFPADDEHHQKKSELEQYEQHPDELKKRVINAKKQLPSSIVPLFIHMFPDFDTYKKKSRISNVLQLRIHDLEITEKLEQIVEHLKFDNQ